MRGSSTAVSHWVRQATCFPAQVNALLPLAVDGCVMDCVALFQHALRRKQHLSLRRHTLRILCEHGLRAGSPAFCFVFFQRCSAEGLPSNASPSGTLCSTNELFFSFCRGHCSYMFLRSTPSCRTPVDECPPGPVLLGVDRFSSRSNFRLNPAWRWHLPTKSGSITVLVWTERIDECFFVVSFFLLLSRHSKFPASSSLQSFVSGENVLH